MTRETELDAAIRRILADSEQPRGDGVERFRNYLAALLVLAFISSLPLLVWKTIPEGNKEIITYILGQISGMALTVIGYYFINKAGQDAIEAKRVETTGKVMDAVNAMTPMQPTPVKVEQPADQPIPVEAKL